MAFTPLVTKDGNNATANIQAFQDASGNNAQSVSLDSNRPTYRFSTAAAAIITTTTKTVLTITGSATKTVRIKKIGAYLTAATAAQCSLQLQRVSAIGTGGTVVSPTAAKLDTLSPAATAVVSHYTTGAQSQGTAVGGLLSVSQMNENVTTTAPTFLGGPAMVMLFPEPGTQAGQSIVLRGVADILEVQNPVALGTTPLLSYFVELEEDAT